MTMRFRIHAANAFLILLGMIIFSGYAWLRLDNARFVHEPRTFGDAGEYLRIASLPLFSSEFWTESKPPITSLLWKTVGVIPGRIFNLQLYVSILSWGILTLCFASLLKSYPIKILGIILLLAFSLSRDIFMWDPFLGSESFSLSFAALFIAAALWLLNGWQWYKLVAFLITCFLIVFTRDTYAYFLLMCAAICLPIFWFSPYRLHSFAISTFFVILFLISSNLATAGLRPYRAVMMITSLRIFPSAIYTDYFRQHGMPVDDSLVELSRNPQPGQKFTVNIALYFDENQERYRQWLRGKGTQEYLKFLWFFKTDTLQRVFLEAPEQSFYPDVYYYTATGYRPIIRDSRLNEILYPTRFGLIYFFGVNILAAFLAAYAWLHKKADWLVPLVLILLSYPQAVIVWAGDANDIARHSIPHNVLMRLGTWMLLLLVVDGMVPMILSKLPEFHRKTTPTSNHSSIDPNQPAKFESL